MCSRQFVVNDVDKLDVAFRPDHSVSFTSLTMTPAVYLARLVERIAFLGGRIHRARLSDLQDLASPQLSAMIGCTPRLAVVCAGLGARTLGGVEDGDVYPTRGQVIKVKAPWIREGFTRQVGSLNGAEGGERTYVIPRPSGEVIIGGTREVNDWEAYPREGTKADIMRRAVEICPTLPPQHASGSWEVLRSIVLDHLVGFRPSREGGVRLEAGPDRSLSGQRVSIVYNYGHGGAGWQSCWGCAEDAARLVLDGLRGELARL
jgi:glycine/D-amino acid oxidase-like deaminating enzyme